MTSWYSLYSWSSISVSYRSRSSALTDSRLRPVTGSQEGRSSWRPNAQDRPPDHRVPPDGAEHAAVRRVRAVVAHDPQATLGDGDGSEIRRRRSWREIGLDQLLPVDEHMAVFALHGLPRQTDDALDVLLGRRLQHPNRLEDIAHNPAHAGALGLLLDARSSRGRVEHDDVAPVGVVQVVGDLRHHHPVPDVELGDHRSRRDEERLGDERLDEESNDDRQSDEEGDLLRQLAARRWRLFHGERWQTRRFVPGGDRRPPTDQRAVRFSRIFAALPDRSRR